MKKEGREMREEDGWKERMEDGKRDGRNKEINEGSRDRRADMLSPGCIFKSFLKPSRKQRNEGRKRKQRENG